MSGKFNWTCVWRGHSWGRLGKIWKHEREIVVYGCQRCGLQELRS